MAPSLKSRRAASTSKHPVKPVVPALPLPYVKRQAAPAAAASAIAASSPPPQPAPGAIRQQVIHHLPVSGAQYDSGMKWDDADRSGHLLRENLDANGHESLPADKSDTASVELGQVQAAALDNAGYQMHAQSQTAEDSMQQSRPVGPFKASPTSNGPPVEHEPKLNADGHYSARAPESHPPPAVSPTRYQMPPPFQPTNRPLGIMANGDVGHGPRPLPQNGPHHIHQAHPSNGSIHFGTFHDSQSSSPAPPRSGGIAPPPGIPGPDGRPGYMGFNGNGFPPMMPYGGEMMQVANFDNYGRPAMAYGPMDSYPPPYGSNYGPSTPHSFHDSQSPVHPEDNGMYGPYPPGGAPRNGGAGPGDDIHPQNPQRRMFGPHDYPRMPPNLGPPLMMPPGDHGDGIIGYLQQQFASPELADCVLELRYPEDSTPPVRIPGHRLIFSRSPELSTQLQNKASEPKAGGAPLTLVVGSDGPWIRSDAFYMAVQRLYGLPLLQIPPHNRTDSSDIMEAGSAKEQFEYSLSYAAAGRLLDWPPVTRRGCEVATQFLGWQTMEKGLEFALENHSDKGTHDSYKYGDGSRAILHAVAAYIVHNIPPRFNLDTSAEEPKNYARLPVHPPPAPASPEAGSRATSPTIARGSSVQLGKGRRPHKIANIQFGDLSLAEARNGAEFETPKATQQAQPVSHMILSRVLLNLPFAHLKMMLEMFGSGNLSGWTSAEARHRVIKRAVEEREARRLRILEALVDGRVTVSDTVRAALRSPNPQDVGRWTSLGWQEEMLPCSSPGGASLVRKWVPLMEPRDESAAAYP